MCEKFTGIAFISDMLEYIVRNDFKITEDDKKLIESRGFTVGSIEELLERKIEVIYKEDNSNDR